MKKSKTTISLVRERGQVTIPDKIRRMAKWAEPSSVIFISLEKPDEISIRPHKTQKTRDWRKIWNAVKLSRSFHGKKGNISATIASDRQNSHE